MSKPSYSIKIVIIGDYSVGKSTLVSKFVEKKFKDNYLPTIGVNITKKTFELDNAQVELLLWDLAGQESFYKVRQRFYSGSHGVFFVYDITRKSSLENIKKWYQEANKYAGSVPYILVGNKIDLEDKRDVNQTDVESVIQKNKLYFDMQFESSAKTGEKVDTAFQELIHKCIENFEQKQKKKRFFFQF